MAAPQRENGFTGIANEILEAVMSRSFTGYQCRVLMALWRETYGWHRTEAPFSLGLAERLTSLRRDRILHVLRQLAQANVVIQVRPGTRTEAAVYRFNKNYEEWEDGCSPGGCSPGREQGCSPREEQGCSPQSNRGCSPQSNTSKKGERNTSSCDDDSDPLPDQPWKTHDLHGKARRIVEQISPILSTLTRERLTTFLALDRDDQRKLEALQAALVRTQEDRRSKVCTGDPVGWFWKKASDFITEPDPNPGEQEFVRAPEGWCPPGYQSRNGAAD